MNKNHMQENKTKKKLEIEETKIIYKNNKESLKTESSKKKYKNIEKQMKRKSY